VKKDTAVGSLKVSQAILVKFSNGTKEVLPVIATTSLGKVQGTSNLKEELTIFTNVMIPASNYLVMDTRKATLTKYDMNGKATPTEIEGRASTGRAFIVPQLKLPGIVNIPDVALSAWEY
jgi:hypothetical protein